MTETGRMKHERDWVQRRYNCTVDRIFEELVAVIRSDVDEFNKLAHEDDQAGFNDEKEGRVVVYLDGMRAILRKDADVIKVHVSRPIQIVKNTEPISFEVEPQWNEETMSCDLLIGEETVSTMKQASQKIIGDVLFPQNAPQV